MGDRRMGIYSNLIFPRLIDVVMSNPEMAKQRQDVLKDATGEILEIGFGTGINLQYYPEQIQKITTLDVNQGMNSLAKKRIEASKIQVDNRVLNSEQLPMADHSFDTVVSTWTLCSIAKVEQALKEIYRVLKIGGKFLFIEHGLSDKPNIQVWQNRLNPLEKIIGDGCHLNRNIQQLVENQFNSVKIKRFNLENTTEAIGYTYKGIAYKISNQ